MVYVSRSLVASAKRKPWSQRLRTKRKKTMHDALEFLAEYWFSVLLLASALVLGVSLLNFWRRRREWSLPLLLLASAFLLLSIGGLALPVVWALWLAGTMLGILFVMVLLVITTGSWSALAGYSVGGLLLLGLGGAGSGTIARGLSETAKLLASL